MTFRDAQRFAFEHGYNLSRDACGDYRLAPHISDKAKAEQQAFYTDDLDDVRDVIRFERKAA